MNDEEDRDDVFDEQEEINSKVECKEEFNQIADAQEIVADPGKAVKINVNQNDSIDLGQREVIENEIQNISNEQLSQEEIDAIIGDVQTKYREQLVKSEKIRAKITSDKFKLNQELILELIAELESIQCFEQAQVCAQQTDVSYKSFQMY